MIREAWPPTPYPGDTVISDCWCDECASHIGTLRGKAWREVELEDFQGESGKLGGDGFHYFLPAYLLMAEREREEDGDTMLLHEVVSHFTVSDSDPMERLACAKQHAGRLTQAQRGVLLHLATHLEKEGLMLPVILKAFRRAVGGEVVRPYSQEVAARESQEICARLLAAGRQ